MTRASHSTGRGIEDVADRQAEPASQRRATRSLLFVSRQLLLAGTLARLFVASEEGWSVDVLDLEHPDLLAECRRRQPDVLVLDVDSHVIPGIELVAQLTAILPAAAVLALGEFDGRLTADALQCGAKGVLTYAATPQQVHDGVEAAAEGRVAVDASALTGLVGGRNPVAAPASAAQHLLSERELDILRRLASGASPRAIAQEFGISVQTVRKHTQNILGKLGVHSKLQAAAVAVRDGLV